MARRPRQNSTPLVATTGEWDGLHQIIQHLAKGARIELMQRYKSRVNIADVPAFDSSVRTEQKPPWWHSCNRMSAMGFTKFNKKGIILREFCPCYGYRMLHHCAGGEPSNWEDKNSRKRGA